MNHETLRLTRNILLRWFVVGVMLALMLGLVTICAWDWWTTMAGTWFHTDTATMTPIVLEFFVDLRFFLLFFVLAPALAIHWTLKHEQTQKR